MLNVIDSLPMPYISLISTRDCYAVFEAWCKKKYIERVLFSLFVLLDLLLTASNLIFDLGLNVLACENRRFSSLIATASAGYRRLDPSQILKDLYRVIRS